MISLAVFVVSCDENRRYEVMTFFFDGVEPPGSLRVAEDFTDPNSSVPARELQEPKWYVHEPRKDCTTCHGRRNQRRSTAKAFLITPVPQLCYSCHDERMAGGPYVHGPVAVGECTFCHNPHKSRIKYLLKGSIPELCYLCHDKDQMESIPDHFVTEISSCMDCHHAHAGLERPLLKEDARRLSRQRAVRGKSQNAEKSSKKLEPTMKPDSDDAELLRRKREIAEIFYASMDLYRQGKLIEARKGLVTVLNSGLIPKAMGETIGTYISDIDRRLSKRTK